MQPNLSKEEHKEMNNLIALQKNGSIVIQPADKNLGISILNSSDYINEGNNQLNETVEINGSSTNYYEKVDSKILKTQYTAIQKYLDDSVKKGIISQKRWKNEGM